MKDGYLYYELDGKRWRVKYDARLLPRLQKQKVDMDRLRTLNGILTKPLYDFQMTAVAHFQRRGGFILADDMGLGKTITSLACAESVRSEKTLVVCPANVKYQWEREIQKSLTRRVTIHVCEGRSIRRYARSLIQFADYVVINYEILSDWQPLLSESHWSIMILDETHRIKKSKSICTKAAKRLRERAGKVICLTGTPMTDRNADLWNVVSIADPTIFPSEFRFQQRYCTGVGSFGKIGGSVNTEELHKILKNTGVMIRRRKREVFKELPKVTHEVIPLKLTSRDLKRAESEALDSARQTRTLTGRDLSGGIMNLRSKIEKYRQETLKAKMPNIIRWIEDFLEGTDEKLMVAVVHRELGGRHLYKHFKDVSVLIDGGLTAKRKEDAKNQFIEDSGTRLLIGNILSVGTGTDGLQKACSNLLYAELDWSPAIMNQCTSRLDRHGQTEPVTVTYLTVKDSIEEFLARSLDRKSEILASVLDGRRVQPEEQLLHLMREYLRKAG